MSYTKEEEGGKIILKIDASLTVYDVPHIYEEVLNCFESEYELEVDVAGVTECDTAGIQLLCAAGKNARIGRHAFRVLGASTAILDALDNLGLNVGEIARCT